MTPYRLRNDAARSWALWPAFEARCLAFIDTHNVDFDKESFRSEIRARFGDPVLDRHRMYVFVDDEASIVGHFLGWVDVAHQRPYLHIHQLEIDGGRSDLRCMEIMFAEVDAWARSINESTPHGPRVDRCEMWTWNDPAIFARYFRSGCDLKVTRYVMSYSLAERAAAVEDRSREAMN